MSLFDIFIWKCSCGYIELWEEEVDKSGQACYYHTKDCPKCKVMMTRQGSLKKRMEDKE